MGHDVRLIPPIYVKPYVKRGKNGAADAAAVCEAMSRPGMRFVPVKSEENQATLMLHRGRQLLIKQQTKSVNALRGHLAEFSIVASKGIGRVDKLVEKAENDATLPSSARYRNGAPPDPSGCCTTGASNTGCQVIDDSSIGAVDRGLGRRRPCEIDQNLSDAIVRGHVGFSAASQSRRIGSVNSSTRSCVTSAQRPLRR